MKIIHFHPNGLMATQFVVPLMLYERENGWDSMIITSTLVAEGVICTQIAFDLNFKNLLKLPLSLIKICLVILRNKPNIVISHNFKSSLIPLLAAWIMNTPTRIYFNHGVPYLAYFGFLYWQLKFLELLNLKLSTNVLTVSSEMTSLLSELSPHKEINIIGNGSACGIELLKFKKNKLDYKILFSELGIRDEDVVFVYLGRPEVRKGIGVVLNLWSKYYKNKKEYKLLLCGPSIGDVRKILGSTQCNILPLGFVCNAPEILAGAKYLLMPSFHEGLSYAILEAMASRCLVLANDIHGNRSLITNGINGFLIRGNCIKSYKEKIESLEEINPQLLENILDNAFETAKQYSRDIFLIKYKKYLNRILYKKSIDYL